MNELKSYTEYAVSTPTADFVIGFDFNYGEDAVNVTVDDVPASVAGYTVVYLNETTIRLSPSVPSGVVRLQRETDIDTTDNQFTAGASLLLRQWMKTSRRFETLNKRYETALVNLKMT